MSDLRPFQTLGYQREKWAVCCMRCGRAFALRGAANDLLVVQDIQPSRGALDPCCIDAAQSFRAMVLDEGGEVCDVDTLSGAVALGRQVDAGGH